MQKRIILYALFFVVLLPTANSQAFDFEDDIEQIIVELIEKEDSNQIEAEKDLIDFARKYLGTRYRAAGKTPEGFDCSGFVGFVFKNFGITLPGSSREIAKVGNPVLAQELKIGDLVFFEGRTHNKIVGHVGIVCKIDENDIYFIHASVQSNVVISGMKEDYYSGRFLLAKRIPLNNT